MIFIQLGEAVCYQQEFPRVPQPALLHTHAPAVLCGATKQSHVLWDASSPSGASDRVQKGTLLGGPRETNVDSPLAVVLAGHGQPTRGQLALSVAPMQGGGDQGSVGIQLSGGVPSAQEPSEG